MSRKYLLFYRVRQTGVQAVLHRGRVRAERHSHFPQVQDVPPQQHFHPNQSVQGTDSPIPLSYRVMRDTRKQGLPQSIFCPKMEGLPYPRQV